jgi:hypothetical protein
MWRFRNAKAAMTAGFTAAASRCAGYAGCPVAVNSALEERFDH